MAMGGGEIAAPPAPAAAFIADWDMLAMLFLCMMALAKCS